MEPVKKSLSDEFQSQSDEIDTPVRSCSSTLDSDLLLNPIDLTELATKSDLKGKKCF